MGSEFFEVGTTPKTSSKVWGGLMFIQDLNNIFLKLFDQSVGLIKDTWEGYLEKSCKIEIFILFLEHTSLILTQWVFIEGF